MIRFAFLVLVLGAISSSTCSLSSTEVPTRVPPIVYTIAGSDSGGGAGIQADLHAIHNMECYGCSAITCLTAQNSVGVTAVHAPPAAFLQRQLDALVDDLPPRAIKIGMLGTVELTETVGKMLKQVKEMDPTIWVVLDPVMISTSGSKLLDDDAIDAMKQMIFPLSDVVTPNKFEAEALLGRELKTPQDVEEGAKELLKLGCKSVLIKGGHSLTDLTTTSNAAGTSDASPEIKATLDYAQDYLLTGEDPPLEGDERLCDGCRGVWMRCFRWYTENTHGTGCTLSSAIASALALGEQSRQGTISSEGATRSIGIVDACCLAKAYVSAGIQCSVKYGDGPGPVAQTCFPSSHENFPSVTTDPTAESKSFPSMKPHGGLKVGDDDAPVLGRILPILDTVEWVEIVASTPGVEDIQLRIKDETDPEKILERVKICQKICAENGIRLWINDHWEAALEAGCFGVHVGQEDLLKCMKAGGLDKLRSHNVALGISTHSYAELSAALGIKPSYVSLGPVFATSSKAVKFAPQGLDIVKRWRKLIPPSIPFVTIGGINDVEAARSNKQAGSDCIAVIGAVTKAEDVAQTVAELNEAMK